MLAQTFSDPGSSCDLGVRIERYESGSDERRIPSILFGPFGLSCRRDYKSAL
jgi:hypothetical protein